MTLRSKGFEIEKPSTNLRYLKPKGFPDWCSGNPLPINLKNMWPEHVQRSTHPPTCMHCEFFLFRMSHPKVRSTSKMENSEARNRFGGEKWKANPLTLEHTETGKIVWIWPRTLLIMFSSNMHWECLAFPLRRRKSKILVAKTRQTWQHMYLSHKFWNKFRDQKPEKGGSRELELATRSQSLVCDS
jgi:hypothetical protein